MQVSCGWQPLAANAVALAPGMSGIGCRGVALATPGIDARSFALGTDWHQMLLVASWSRMLQAVEKYGTRFRRNVHEQHLPWMLLSMRWQRLASDAVQSCTERRLAFGALVLLATTCMRCCGACR